MIRRQPNRSQMTNCRTAELNRSISQERSPRDLQRLGNVTQAAEPVRIETGPRSNAKSSPQAGICYLLFAILFRPH